MKQLRIKIIWLTVFSIAMGFMEAAVVVYLRRIYYPHGFQFPLTPVEPSIGMTEFLREAATIIMLLAIGILTGKNTSQKFGIFIFSFAVWDIFYYVFLKLFIGWPESFFTWDILFIIPVPWVGPVLAPCVVSLTMIALTFSVIYYQEKGIDVHLKMKEWILLIAGALVIILSFVQDYLKYCSIHNARYSLPWKDTLFNEISTYVPSSFNWWIFTCG
ncbi:MAG TPA: hypothetical protein VK808_12655, partial [Bacteroidia bacterium]|nr:hypothetical protein [Bacteroidia bacterium]